MFTSICGLILLFLHKSAIGFNVDVATRIVQRGEKDSHFGYSVDLYSGADGEWVLVGAPKATTTVPGVEHGGRVYRCVPDRRYCSPMEFDNRSPAIGVQHGHPIQTEIKSNQWFGATVRSNSNGSKIIACAPRYRVYYPKFDRISPVGSCWMVHNQDLDNVKEHAPCRNQRKWGRHRLGYCMSGFSAAIPDDDDNFWLGAPGAFYWQGTLIRQKASDPTFKEHKGIGPDYLDDRYLGYHTVTGDFNDDGIADTAVSAPKGALSHGLVILYNDKGSVLHNLTGEQAGSYFGGSLASVDVDGDGRDDLIVGGPTYSIHTHEKGSAKSKYEVGRVYIYLQGSFSNFKDQVVLSGKKEWARFGHSLAGCGDMNGDGYGDFAVGAPWDGPKRRGAVYIFNGKQGGVHEEPSQIVYAEDVETRGVRQSPTGNRIIPTELETFGFSVAGGRDLDGNGFPDVVVGAYKSDRAVVFRSRPLVTLKGVLKVLSPSELDLEDKSCQLKSGTRVPCGKLRFCVAHKSKGTDDDPIRAEVLVKLDTDKPTANRTLFLDGANPGSSQMVHRVTLEDQGIRKCETRHFYVNEGIRDKLTPIVITANYSVVDEAPDSFEMKPALDPFGTTGLSQSIDIKKACGPDNVCVPDLKITSDVQTCRYVDGSESCAPAESFVLGADESLNVTVTATNDGEDAYESQLRVEVPPGVDYVEYVKLTPNFPAVCSTPEGFGDHNKGKRYNLTCDIGNPLPQGEAMRLTFKNVVKDLNQKNVEFRIFANTSNPEKNETLKDNVQVLSVPLEAKPLIAFLSASKPESVTYDESKAVDPVQWDFDIGPAVTHTYQVRNDGPTALKRAEVDIYWPLKIRSGGKSYLLYLSQPPEVVGNGSCSIYHALNPEHYGLHYTGDRKRRSTRRHQYDRPGEASPLNRPRRQATEEENEYEEPGVISRGLVPLVNKLREWGKTDKDAAAKLRSLQVDCSEYQCAHIQCDVGPLSPGADTIINVHSWLYINTLIKEALYDASVSSMGVLKVTELPYKMEQLPTEGIVTTTKVSPSGAARPDRDIPWWVWFIAVLAGIVLLALIILLLWKFGFFERKKPPAKEEGVIYSPDEPLYGYPVHGTQHGTRL